MRFVVSGYFGFGNTGDEAMLAAMVQHLRDVDPDAAIVALSNHPELTMQTHGIPAIGRTALRQIIREVAAADLVISGSGSLLQDVTSFRSLAYYLGLVALARLMGTPVFFYSQGVGPLRRAWSRWLVRLVANGATAITVRDEPSRRLLEAIGVRRPPVQVTADPVFGMELSPSVRSGEDMLASEGVPVSANAPLVVVSVRPWKAGTGWLEAIARAADEAERSLGAAVVFTPFHKPGDVVASRAVAELMRGRSYVLKGDYSPQEMMSLIDRADLVIGMRYHALVFAAARAKPFVAVSYDPKIDGLLEMLGEEPGITTASRGEQEVDEEALVRKVTDVWERRDSIREALKAIRPALAEAAKRAAFLAAETARTGRQGSAGVIG
ncbi:MAG: polysaccharide pyruvyl transferase CsaB [Firmicutes bacterium]|jgi:polysaccharide pyruvyl transferase CsaB|nr:polysaccharide pyruvyl transferase CsaB [Bacillota bacterium]MDH7495253.1 polysaccharide pyruvyl transferase CsaB [Bacillota bacterium]